MFQQLTSETARALAQARIPEQIDAFMAVDKFGGTPLFLYDGTTVLSLSLRPEHKLIWVTGVVGSGIQWLFDFQRFGLEIGYDWVGFKVSKDLPWGKAIKRFSKAQLMASDDTGEEYCASLRAR